LVNTKDGVFGDCITVMRFEADYLKDALAFSSKRRVLFVKLYQKIGAGLGFEQISEEVLVEALEHIHGSATIIDDMLDNDYLRKEIPSYYIRHGNAVAAFAALNLMMRGIELISTRTDDLKRVLRIVREMIDAEEADVGLQKRPATTSPLDWYQDVVSKKIAGELLLILQLCSKGSQRLSTTVAELEQLTCLLGQFIQYCDDWYDVLVESPLAQTGANDDYVLTYSLPLALYLTNAPDDLEDFVGKKIDREIARTIIEKISAAANKDRTEKFIETTYESFINLCRWSSIPSCDELAEMATTVKSKAYWEKKYYEPA
jgi:geranylgeranyl pyrophosphate synthase